MIAQMDSVFSVLIPLALVAVLAILIVGVVSMLRGGTFNSKYSNKLMRLRVIAQLVAILLIGAFFLLSRH
jgi:Hypoxia induced protein conserved region